MISLSYSCSCGWASGVLDAAQTHADDTGHTVDVQGRISRIVKPISKQIEKNAKEKARDAMIMRVAKERGLVKNGR